MMAARSLLALALIGLVAAKPLMHETFGSGWETRWQHSEDDKYSGKFEVEAPTDFAGDGLKVPEKAKHYGISALLDSPVDPASGLALQYEVKLTEGLSCGGAYLKFLTAEKTFTPAGLKDDTPYTVMFGPDKCGATNKVHLILRHKNPKTGTIEEKHLKSPPTVPTDDKTHVYTAVIKPDNTFSVLVDGVEKSSGSLLEEFLPSFVPPTEIADPEDSKPEDWVDTAKIPDPEAVKPEDWDEDAPREVPDEDAEKPEDWLEEEPLQVADPAAEKPEDWDEEEDGEWEAPQVPNPKCAGVSGCGEWKRPTKPNPAFKGKWSAPLIDNPEYKGPWKPRDIPNPEYHDDTEPLKHIGQVGAVAAEIWTMDAGIFFDNIVIASDGESVAAVREAYWKPKHDKEVEAARKEEEAKAKDVSDSSAKGPDPAVEALKAAIDGVPFLAAHKATLAPLVAALEATPAILYAAVIVPALLLLVLILRAVAKPSSAAAPPDAAAAAKKTDTPSADDVAPAVANNVARAAAASTEIEEDEGGAVRRRTRRDT